MHFKCGYRGKTMIKTRSDSGVMLYYLVLGRDVRGPVYPAEILGEIRVDTLELTTKADNLKVN
jgi:hypothetical protein